MSMTFDILVRERQCCLEVLYRWRRRSTLVTQDRHSATETSIDQHAVERYHKSFGRRIMWYDDPYKSRLDGVCEGRRRSLVPAVEKRDSSSTGLADANDGLRPLSRLFYRQTIT
jgi:hypothetical protein